MKPAIIDLIARADEDVEAIAVHLLGEPNRRASSSRELRWGEHGRTSLTLSGPRLGKWHDWRDDTGGDALDLVEQELGLDRHAAIEWVRQWFGGAAPVVDHVASEQRKRAAEIDDDRVRQFKRQAAADIWNAATPLSGSPAESYLLRTRLGGRPIPEAIYRADALRWAGSEQIPGSIGALIALMTDPLTGVPTGVHRTWIDGAFQRIERKMLGQWGCVRLWPDTEVTSGLAIGEGIETTIAGVLLSDRAPAWAAVDAGGLRKFPVLSGIECISIFVDNDDSNTGQAAAEACAARWHEADREACLLTPTAVGADFNSILEVAV
jgi:Toprim domain